MLDVNTYDIRDALKAGFEAMGFSVGDLAFTMSPTALPGGPGVAVWGMQFKMVKLGSWCPTGGVD